ncbi:DUF3564 family protein [Paraburkholderia sp. SIMBA_030]|uniref:DUF3564 family protein n=1 Tax=Paraburkholderia sp. SIMBA_030 TaxID=3085773 RepID=UPI00397E7C55
MRLSILINCSDPTVSHDYAVLWLDIVEQAWSRQLCNGIELPPFGEIHSTGGLTLLCPPGSEIPLCTLRGLRMDRHQRTSIAEGAATWQSATRRMPVEGCWHLRAVDRQLPGASVSTAAPPERLSGSERPNARPPR